MFNSLFDNGFWKTPVYITKMSVVDVPVHKWSDVSIRVTNPDFQLNITGKTSLEVAYELYKALAKLENQQAEETNLSQEITALESKLNELRARQGTKQP